MNTNDLLDAVLISRRHTSPFSSQGDSPTVANPFSPTSTLASPTASGASAVAAMAASPSADPDAPAVCPVDHKTRDAWIAQARAQQEKEQQAATASSPAPAAVPSTVNQPPPSKSFFSRWFGVGAASSQSPSVPPSQQPGPRHPHNTLGTDRVVSSIPRTATTSSNTSSSSATAPRASAPSPPCPVNHEVETGADPASGNWIYPSEKMFFEAMKRKGHDNARVADMKVVVPIHNAVNERAWREICDWEAPYTGTAAGQCASGPRLHSFAGLGGGDQASRMSPRARLYTLLGYTAPFDRHDWVVDRCGRQVEYIIDFYAGRPGKPQQQLSFYLDVRPKLNSWEGVKMRALRVVGLQ